LARVVVAQFFGRACVAEFPLVFFAGELQLMMPASDIVDQLEVGSWCQRACGGGQRATCVVWPGGSGVVIRRRGVQTSGGCGLVEATVLWAGQVGYVADGLYKVADGGCRQAGN